MAQAALGEAHLALGNFPLPILFHLRHEPVGGGLVKVGVEELQCDAAIALVEVIPAQCGKSIGLQCPLPSNTCRCTQVWQVHMLMLHSGDSSCSEIFNDLL